MTTDPLTIIHGDCVEVMRSMPENSVDAIVTDPPYGLGFMGKEWDNFVPSVVANHELGHQKIDHKKQSGRSASMHAGLYDLSPRGQRGFQSWTEAWATEALRVLKPGGYLLSFGGTRTYHRMTCAIEDAGFEIRDCLVWMYGSGFPKSYDVSKGFDKKAGERVVVGTANGAGSSNTESLGVYAPEYEQTIPATDLARQWDGWGTALKPGWESIVMAQKPLAGAAELVQWAREVICFVEVLSCRLKCGANGAVARSWSSPSECVAECGSAQWAAALPRNTQVALSDLTGMWLSESAQILSLSTVSSWLGISVDLWTRASTFTTVTASSLTTDLRTLSFLLSSSTQYVTALSAIPPSGIGSNAPSVAAIFSAVASKLALIPSPTARGSATEQRAPWERDPEASRLSPNSRPIVLARKPLIGTVVANVERYGTGALNIDGGRIGTDERFNPPTNKAKTPALGSFQGLGGEGSTVAGRWPANVLLDEEAAAMLDEQSGESVSSAGVRRNAVRRDENVYGGGKGIPQVVLEAPYTDRGGASRFFYTAKASRSDRGAGNTHPTVKPVELMRYLVRLVTPPGGLVLDPFAGSGTTGQAALAEGFRCTLIEKEAEYVAGIKAWRGAMQLGFGMAAR